MSNPMLPDEVVLKVEKLGKRFKIYAHQTGRLKEWLSLGRRTYHRDFWSLKDISFEVHRGEFMGIIGPNGAGKSTLLKVITGVLDPTTGSHSISGRVLSLLELSGGMDNDLTGRENIIRSAQLLGFSSSFARERMDQIAEFAELGEFFDAPLSIYSSGMRIRLAFSMFAFLDCDILILDEVLAVGDIFFRQKCYARLEELIKKNTAIVLVTHSMGTVLRYCDHVVVLKGGEMFFMGAPDQAVQKYFQIKEDKGIRITVKDTYAEEDFVPAGMRAPGADPSGTILWPPESAFAQQRMPGNAESAHARLLQLAICDEDGKARQVFRQGETACFYFAYQALENMGVPIATLALQTQTNLVLHSKNSLQQDATPPPAVAVNDVIRYKQTMKLDLAPGSYIFNLNLTAMHPQDYAKLDILSEFDLKEKQVEILSIKPAGLVQVSPASGSGSLGVHGGFCNLAGEQQVELLGSGNAGPRTGTDE